MENFNEYIENFSEYIESLDTENLMRESTKKNEHAGAIGSVVKWQSNNGIWLLEGNTGIPKEKLRLFLEAHISVKIINNELYNLSKIYLFELADDYKFTTLDDAISRVNDSDTRKIIESLINGGINKKLFHCGRIYESSKCERNELSMKSK